MARKHRHELLAGGFIVMSLCLLVLIIFLKGTFREIVEQAEDLRVVFDDVKGLKLSDPVFFLGSKVGRVSGLEVVRGLPPGLAEIFPSDAAETSRVIVTLR